MVEEWVVRLKLSMYSAGQALARPHLPKVKYKGDKIGGDTVLHFGSKNLKLPRAFVNSEGASRRFGCVLFEGAGFRGQRLTHNC